MDKTQIMSQHLCFPKMIISRLMVGLMAISFFALPVFAETSEDSDQDQVLTPQDQIEKDLALFWGKKREVKVVQRRLFSKDGKLDLTIGGGIIPNDDFLVYYLSTARVGYHFAESFEVEASGSFAFEQLSGLGDFLRNESDIGLKDAQIREFIRQFYNISVLWSPVYGKVSFLGQKLTHFDVFLGAGLGLMFTEGYESPENPDLQSKSKLAANIALGFRWHINNQFSIRTEYRHYFFEKIAANELSTPIGLNLGVTTTF